MPKKHRCRISIILTITVVVAVRRRVVLNLISIMESSAVTIRKVLHYLRLISSFKISCNIVNTTSRVRYTPSVIHLTRTIYVQTNSETCGL